MSEKALQALVIVFAGGSIGWFVGTVGFDEGLKGFLIGGGLNLVVAALATKD